MAYGDWWVTEVKNNDREKDMLRLNVTQKYWVGLKGGWGYEKYRKMYVFGENTEIYATQKIKTGVVGLCKTRLEGIQLVVVGWGGGGVCASKMLNVGGGSKITLGMSFWRIVVGVVASKIIT